MSEDKSICWRPKCRDCDWFKLDPPEIRSGVLHWTGQCGCPPDIDPNVDESGNRIYFPMPDPRLLDKRCGD